MIAFPKSTFVGRFLAKEQLYKRDVVDGGLKQSLIADIAKITIEYNLSARTLNVEPGAIFPEITVLKLVLKHKKVNEKLLNAIDKSILSSYVLFILEFENEQSLSIAFKDKTTVTSISKRWNTEWSEDIGLDINGSTIDQIYRNFIEQISGGLVGGNNADQIKDSVAQDIERDKILRQIAKLESKMYSESQLNKQIEIKHQISALKEKING